METVEELSEDRVKTHARGRTKDMNDITYNVALAIRDSDLKMELVIRGLSDGLLSLSNHSNRSRLQMASIS